MRSGTGIVFITFAILSAPAAFGQAGAPLPAFEVASVKPDLRGKGGGMGSRREIITPEPGRLTMLNVSMDTCIAWAYGVKSYQVSGPGWMEDERYDIAAKAPGAVPEKELRLMIQGLLAERFKLAFHRQPKDLPVLVLQVAKNGPKFHESKDDGDFSIQPTGKATVTIQRAAVSQLVDLLTQVLRMPILDETGLQGRYDIAVDMTSYIPEHFDHSMGPPPDMAGIVMAALPEQLGLKLESRKTMLDMLMVDHVEKTPTEN